MVLMTLIARLHDGLPLCASTEDDSSEDLREQKGYAKELVRRLTQQSPARCTVTSNSGNYVFHYAIEKDIVYLALCHSRFPKGNAFAFLEDIQQEFDAKHGADVSTQGRPYHFIAFDKYLQKTKRKFTESGGSRANLDKVKTELTSVSRIMVQNIEEVLERGAQIESMKDKALNLKMNSAAYLNNAKELSWDMWIRKYAPVITVGSVVSMLCFYFIFF